MKAHELGLASIALPAISSGIFGFPKDRCARILVQTALDFCARHPSTPLREIRFTNIDRPTVEVFQREFERRFGEG
jgi:putative ATPase